MPEKLSTCVAGMVIASALALPAATNTTASAAPWCAADALSLSTVGPMSPGDQSQIRLNVVLTNVSQQTCLLQGYPGLDLVGPDDPEFGPTYSLPRQSGDPQPVVLAPGAAADSALYFLPGGDGGWVPTTIVVTPPDATTQLQTPWSAGLSVLRQDAATHPGTYIGPLQPYE